MYVDQSHTVLNLYRTVFTKLEQRFLKTLHSFSTSWIDYDIIESKSLFVKTTMVHFFRLLNYHRNGWTEEFFIDGKKPAPEIFILVRQNYTLISASICQNNHSS